MGINEVSLFLRADLRTILFSACSAFRPIFNCPKRVHMECLEKYFYGKLVFPHFPTNSLFPFWPPIFPTPDFKKHAMSKTKCQIELTKRMRPLSNFEEKLIDFYSRLSSRRRLVGSDLLITLGAGFPSLACFCDGDLVCWSRRTGHTQAYRTLFIMNR